MGLDLDVLFEVLVSGWLGVCFGFVGGWLLIVWVGLVGRLLGLV